MKRIRITQLRARLSEYLRVVRRGHTLIVLNRKTPIARIVPYADDAMSLKVRAPSAGSPPINRVPLPPPLDVGVDVVTLLLEERQGGR